MKAWIEELAQKIFRVSVNAVNHLCVVCLLLLIAGLLPMAMWKLTGSGFCAYAAIVIWVLAFAAMLAGFAGQTVNVVLRGLAWLMNKGKNFFEPEKPLAEVYAPQVKRAVTFLKQFRPFQMNTSCLRANRVIQGSRPICNQIRPHAKARTHARSYRSHARPSFASGGGGSSDDGSGSGDEPPGHEHEHPVTQPNPSEKPKNPDKKTHPWRRLGSCRAPRGFYFVCLEGRRSA